MNDYKEIEKDYRQNEWPRVLKSIDEWIEEFPKEWRDERRREYLIDEIDRVRDEFFHECMELAKRDDDLTFWSEKNLEQLEKRLRILGMEVKILIGGAVGISPQQIEKARKHPINDFIAHRGYMALCPFHKERTPSFNIKNNFYYCYGCQAHGDVIDFVMKTQNRSFKEAITQLSV